MKNEPDWTYLVAMWREAKEAETMALQRRRQVESQILELVEKKTSGTVRVGDTELRVTFKENRRWNQDMLEILRDQFGDDWPFKQQYVEIKSKSTLMERYAGEDWARLREALEVTPALPYFSILEKKP